MEDAQSLFYNSIGSEMDFDIDVLQLVIDGQSFHADDSDYSRTLADEMNNNNGAENAKPPFPNLTSTWLNGFTSVGNSKPLECVEDEIAIGAIEGFPDKTDSEDLANGLSVSYMNWTADDSFNKFLENRTGFTGSKATDTNNSRLIGGGFAFSKQHLDLVGEGKISPEKRKTTATETFTNTDNIDGLGEAFDETNQNILKMRKDRSVESTNFEMKKPKESDLLSIPKRKKTKISDTVDSDEFGATNLTSTVSSKRVTQLASVAGRGRNRNAKTRICRSETGFSTTFDDSSPVPSPEAEVPSLSPINPNEYINDDELIDLETKELNRRIKFLPKHIVQEIKHRRRTLKNRGYARSCRDKKMSETNILQRSNGDLEKELASKRVELQLMMLQRDDWKRKYVELASACKKRGIQVEQ